MADVSIKSKVTVTNFKPKTVPFDSYKDKPAVVGYIIGRVMGISERTDTRTGEMYRGLSGTFKQLIGADFRAPKEVLGAGICYLPDSFQNMVEQAWNDAGGKGAVVDFVYEVSLGRRGEQDYEWVFREMRPAAAVDPLASLMQETQAALPAPEKEKPASK